MSIDLKLGFSQRPEDLQRVMEGRGFSLEGVIEPDSTFPLKMEMYTLFDEGRSKRGVRFTYHDGTYTDHAEDWIEIVDDPGMIVATGSITTSMDRSAFDEKVQRQTARFLRDRYSAILYDPQSGEIVTD